MQPHLQAKRIKKPTRFDPLPVTSILNSTNTPIIGYFNGFGIQILDKSSISLIYDNGGFGIDLITKSVPINLISHKNKLKNVDNSSLSIKPINSTSTPAPILYLFWEEAFFLHYTLKSLKILNYLNNNEEINANELLAIILNKKPTFIITFIGYLYLKSKNWIIKSGLKFGADFLLYKDGPRYYHASYAVLVKEANTTNGFNDLKSQQLHGHYRICETSKKDLLIIEVTWPTNLPKNSSTNCLLNALKDFTVTEITPKRFSFNQERIIDNNFN